MHSYFKPEIHIVGVNTPDLHTLNTVLGATIEEQAVATLNAMRSAWDPGKQYLHYSFVRQAQVFPDVLLRRAPGVTGPGDDIILGIEMKGWYVAAREAVPTFRFVVTPDACADADFVVVMPWALSEVISGRPIMFPPFIEIAKYAAEHRNHWWQHVRKARGDTTIVAPDDAHPYPSKADKIDDMLESDTGSNFGRLARTGLMDDYIAGIMELLLSGVPIAKWVEFFGSLAE